MNSFVEIPYGNQDVIINTSEIISVVNNNGSVTVNLTSGKAYTFKTTIEKFREILKPVKIDAERVKNSLKTTFAV